MEIGNKIAKLRKEKKMSQKEFSELLNVSERTLRDYEKGRFPVNSDFIQSLIDNFKINLNDFFETGDKFPVIEQVNKDKYLIPQYNITPSAGNGAFITDPEEITDYILVNKNWLYKRYNIIPDFIIAMKAFGTSMYPTICEDDLLIIDTSKQIEIETGIYVYRIDDCLMVKRLDPIKKNKIHVISDNDKYPPYILELNEQDNFSIIGQVIHIIQIRKPI